MHSMHSLRDRRACAGWRGARRALVVALLLATSALTRTAAAQEDSVARDTTSECRRCLNGHRSTRK